ncbi:MDR family MFS transporter [Bacillus thuringiensis]|uniref:MDR family MFS transporter n=1 Tax=Bacillus thuringiensis TaxID=1428 RepID=UPI000BFCC8A4|nr:MFS transporter [Bacillus thuringiensis]PGO45477.1 MFS transporter [Bacillus thuringiensis]
MKEGLEIRGYFSEIHPISINIIFGTLFSRLTMAMSMPFLAIYLTTTKGISPVMAGLIIGISAFVNVLAGFIGGNLSDKYGRKVVLLSSLSVWILVFIGFAFADSAITFFILNALNGLCRAFFEPTSRALLSEYTNESKRLLVYNLRYTAINIGAAIGPLIGFGLGSSQTTFPFFITSFVYLIYTISLALLLKKYNVKIKNNGGIKQITIRQSIGILKQDRVFIFSLIGFICCMIGFSQFMSTLPQYLANTSAFSNGVEIFTCVVVTNAIAAIVFQYPLLRVGKKYSALVSIIVGVAIIGIGLIGFGLSNKLIYFILSMILFTMGEVLIFSMNDLFTDTIAPSHLKGTYFGMMNFMNLGQLIGPWLGGGLLSYYGYDHGPIIFLITSLFCILGIPALVMANVIARKKKKNNSCLEQSI